MIETRATKGKKAVLILIVLIVLLIGGIASADQVPEKGFEITVNKNTVQLGELITWTVTARNFSPDDQYELFWEICDDNITLAHGYDTWENGDTFSITYRSYESGRLYLSIDAYIYGDGYLYFGDDYESWYAESEKVTVAGASPLSLSIVPDRTTASGQDNTVTWTITPSGGTPAYELHVEFSFGADHGAMYDEKVIVSNGEPVQYTNQLLVGWDGNDAAYNFYYLTVTAIDQQGNSTKEENSVYYENPLYYPASDFPNVRNLCMYEEAKFTFIPEGSVAPYTDYRIQIYTVAENVLIKEFAISKVNNSETPSVNWIVDDPIILRSPLIYVVRSFTDALGYRWKFYSTASTGSFEVGLHGRIITTIKPCKEISLAGDVLDWEITANRPFYYQTSYLNQEYDVTITPFFRDTEGTEHTIGSPTSIATKDGKTAFSIEAEKEGEYYLSVDVTDKYAQDMVTDTAHGETIENAGICEVYKGILQMPETLKNIEEEAFAGIHRMIIIVPDHIESIAASSFDEDNIFVCTEGSPAWMRLQQVGFRLIEKSSELIPREP